MELTLTALEQNTLGQPRCWSSATAQEALDYLYCRGKFKTRPPGNPILVLLDNKMPKVSGLQVLKAVKLDENLKAIPVVALASSRKSPA